jgi:hypothetical protein
VTYRVFVFVIGSSALLSGAVTLPSPMIKARGKDSAVAGLWVAAGGAQSITFYGVR